MQSALARKSHLPLGQCARRTALSNSPASITILHALPVNQTFQPNLEAFV